MPCCVAVNCSNRSEKGFRLFKFPANKIRCAKWVENLHKDKLWTPKRTSYLCEVHFEENQFENHRTDGWKKLKPNAIPTMFDIPKPGEPRKKTKYKVPKVRKQSPQPFQPDPLECEISENPRDYIDLVRENMELKQTLKTVEEENEELKQKLKGAETKLSEKNAALETFLNADQIRILQDGRLSSWPNESIIKGLMFRFALSLHGYEFLRSTGYPLPAYSTLTRRMQDFKLKFGIFDEVLKLLKFKVQAMDPADRQCVLSYDEMVISDKQEHDKNLGDFVGSVTLGSGGDSKVVGEKMFVVVARGVKNRWKQVIACHVTSKQTSTPEVLQNFIIDCIFSVEECGLHVLALSSDLDGKNRSLWRTFNIQILKCGTRTNSFSFNEHAIYAIPDVCHILRNLKSAILREKIYLPDAYVVEEKLPTKIVDGEHLKALWHAEINGGKEVHRLHHLRSEDIEPSQLDQMNVDAAVRFFSPQTASAIESAIKEKILPEDAVTTASFIRIISKWFRLLSSKVRKTSITLRNCDRKYIFLHKIVELFHDAVFGENWKPLNYAVVLATLSFCDISEFLFKNSFEFVLGNRFTLDATESIFSQVRSKEGRIPTALQCLRALSGISVSQFVSDVNHASPSNDSDIFELDFCNEKSSATMNVNKTKAPELDVQT